MRFTWLPFGLALAVPAAALLGGCGPGNTSSSGGGGSTTTTTATGGGGTGGTTGGTGGMTGGGGSTGGTTGGGGTGGVAPPANDLCPGEKVAIAIDTSTTLNGTLKGALDDYETFCADMDPQPSAPDVVYELDVPATSTVTITINATGFVPALSLRKQECSQRLPGDACLDLGTGNVSTTVALEAGTYWVVVDSADKNVGDFTMDVKYASPACGDGVVGPGEQCDPPTVSNDDGCINPGMPNGCHFGEPPPDPAIVACPGGLITISAGDSFQLGPYNNGSGGHNEINITDAVECISDAIGPEDIFHITPTGDGTLTATIGHDEDGTTLWCATHADCGDFIMYLRKNMCDSVDAADQLTCADQTLDPNGELITITVPVTGGQDYWLVVDGLDDQFGVGGYYLQLSLQ